MSDNLIFDLDKLRYLYSRRNHKPTKLNRLLFRMTIMPATYSWLAYHIPLGRGKFASAFSELAIRFMLAILTDGERLEEIVGELMEAENSPYLTNNLIRVLKMMGVPIKIERDVDQA